MTKWIGLVAVLLGINVVAQHYPIEELVRAALTLYLIIAGFAVLLLQHRASEFLRPLLPIVGALLFLPPLFQVLTHCLMLVLRVSQSPTDWSWLWQSLAAALIVFVLFRTVVWYRSRPQQERPIARRDRERVVPPLYGEEDAED